MKLTKEIEKGLIKEVNDGIDYVRMVKTSVMRDAFKIRKDLDKNIQQKNKDKEHIEDGVTRLVGCMNATLSDTETMFSIKYEVYNFRNEWYKKEFLKSKGLSEHVDITVNHDFNYTIYSISGGLPIYAIYSQLRRDLYTFHLQYHDIIYDTINIDPSVLETMEKSEDNVLNDLAISSNLPITSM